MNNTNFFDNAIDFNNFDIKLLFKNIPAIIYIKDNKSNYLFGNALSKEFLLNKYDAISGKYLNLNNCFSTLETNHYLQHFRVKEKMLKDNENHPHWYRIYNFPIKNSTQGNYTLVIIQNIDSEKIIQEQKENFIASLCHDLKNPTIAQIKCLELLMNEKNNNLNTSQKEFLNMLLESCKYMENLLSTTLDTYKFNNGLIQICRKEFSIKKLISNSISEMLPYAKVKNISILLISKLQSEIIVADDIQLKRVIMNLLSNSIKYGYNNTDLKIKIYDTKSYFYFELENSSPYIPKNIQKIIFNKYMSFTYNNNESGTGLGLYTSKMIINAHNGELYLKSSQKDKNIFIFKIPIKN